MTHTQNNHLHMHIRIQKKSLVSGTKYQSTAISLALHRTPTPGDPYHLRPSPVDHTGAPITTRWQPPERTKRPRTLVGTGPVRLVSEAHGVRRSAIPWPGS